MPKSRVKGRDEAIKKLFEKAPATKRTAEVIKQLAETAGVTTRLIQMLVKNNGWERKYPYDTPPPFKFPLISKPGEELSVPQEKPKKERKQRAKKEKPEPKPRGRKPKPEPEISNPNTKPKLEHNIPEPTPGYILAISKPPEFKKAEYNPTEWENINIDGQINWITQVSDTFLETGEYPTLICEKLGLPKRYFRKWIKENFVCRDIWYKTSKEHIDGVTTDMLFFLAGLVKESMERSKVGQSVITSEFISTGVDAEGNIKGFWKPVKKVQQPPSMPDIGLISELNKTISVIQNKVENVRNEIISLDEVEGISDLSSVELEVAQLELEIERLKRAKDE